MRVTGAWFGVLALFFWGCGESAPGEAGETGGAGATGGGAGAGGTGADAEPPWADAGAGEPDAEPPAPDAANAGDPDPAAPGPFQVGVCTRTLTDPTRNRSFDVEYWYPVAPGATDGEPNTYEVGSLAALPSPALRGASPASGARPVVLFSHGFGGIRFQSFFLTERLASHGFIVVAPDHPGNRLQDFAQLGSDEAAAQSAVDRPLDVIYALDRLLSGEACADLEVDFSAIGTTGHSFGGWTALEVARRDPRIAATFPLAPGFKKGATADFVAEIGRPLFLFGGSEDGTTPFDSDQLAPYQLAQTPKYLVRVEGAGHLDFSNLCQVPIAKMFIDDGCDPAKVDPLAVHAKVNALSVAFARRYLLEQPSYAAQLLDAYVLGLGGLSYWREP